MANVKKYRQCVVGVFINNTGKVLVGERSDAPGNWQFPQGGVEAGERPEQAILREMTEELGASSIEIIKTASETCRYDFPADLNTKIAHSYRGQEQTWFLLRFQNGFEPTAVAGDGEFRAFKWTTPDLALDKIIGWKKDCYSSGLKLLGLLEEQTCKE